MNISTEKRFLVFAFEKYHPKGGMNDFWKSYDHPAQFYQELAEDAADKNYDGLYRFDFIQVYDSETHGFYEEILIDGMPEKS
jgi:hypothetical protein